MADRIQFRRDTAARWSQFNPILLEGEIGVVTDNPNQYKIGDGINGWNSLPLRGYNGTVVEDLGADSLAVMSQKAVTDVLDENLFSLNYDELTSISEETGVLRSNGTVDTNQTSWITKKYDVENLSRVYASGRSGNESYCLAYAYDADDTPLESYYVGGSTIRENVVIKLPSNAKYLRVSGNSQKAANAVVIGDEYKFYTKEETNNLINNHWSGKTIWWCGTSIPEGGYPQLIAPMLDCTIINEAKGSSGCRRSTLSGDYNGMHWQNMAYSLSQTSEEKEYIINNWSTIRQTLIGDPPETLSTSQQAMIRGCTFEERLLPYINQSDLFVYDHGHNDWKYNKPSSFGGGTDIGVMPTVENIESGLLAEDTYMTDNNNAKLIEFFGDLSKIPNLNDWIASINRNCFIGATNFIMMLILKNKPHARIMMVTNNRLNKQGLVDAQLLNSESWYIPICKIYEYLMYSDHVIPGTNNYWGDNRENDLSVFDLYNKDGVHPHSDTSGNAIKIIAGVLSEFISKIR